jgi:hypothetical protein
METKTFFVQGSAPEPYKVGFYKINGQLRASCSCQAGENGMYCKHRLRILQGDTTGLVDGNLKDIETVQSWLPGTDLERALDECLKAERVFREAEKEFKAAKKLLSRIMEKKH